MGIAAFSGAGPLLTVAMGEKETDLKCLVAFYSFLDIQGSDYFAPYEPSEVVKSFSPIAYLTKAEHLPPIFIARAGKDTVPLINESIDRFVLEALKRGAAITVVNNPLGRHGFDNKNDIASERSREIIGQAIAFIRHHLTRAGNIRKCV